MPFTVFNKIKLKEWSQTVFCHMSHRILAFGHHLTQSYTFHFGPGWLWACSLHQVMSHVYVLFIAHHLHVFCHWGDPSIFKCRIIVITRSWHKQRVVSKTYPRTQTWTVLALRYCYKFRTKHPPKPKKEQVCTVYHIHTVPYIMPQHI